MSSARRSALIGFLVCLALLAFLLVLWVRSASAESLTGGKPPYRYCVRVFSDRPPVCMNVPNGAGRWIDCRVFKSCKPRFEG